MLLSSIKVGKHDDIKIQYNLFLYKVQKVEELTIF